ncbi:MAG: Gfo/Idh/MocA family oxidoreductase [Bacteroidales bacterium]
MSEKTLQWGMIGCGNVTEKKSAPSFNKIPGSRLVAVGSRTPERAREYAKRNGIPSWHRDPFDVITDPEVHIVYVATPPGSHATYALQTIGKGKPVYIEKPMALNGEECDLINRKAEEKGIPVFVAYYRRALEYFLKIREIVDAGTLGRILTIHMQQYFPARPEDHNRQDPPWRVRPEISGGGYFHDVGCHALDILFFLFGDPVRSQGMKANLAGIYGPEDTVSATIALPHGAILTGSWSFIVPESLQKDLVEVTGEKGKLSFSVFGFDPIVLFDGNSDHTYRVSRPEPIQMPLIRTIVSSLKGTGTCPSTGRTAAITSRVMDTLLAEG